MLLCRTVGTGYGLRFDQLLDEIPPEVFEQWRTLYEIEPWDAERTDWAFDELAAVVSATHGVQPRGSGAYMRFLKQPEPKKETEADGKEVVEGLCKALSKWNKSHG